MNKLDNRMGIKEYLDRESCYRVLNTLSKEELMDRYYSKHDNFRSIIIMITALAFLGGYMIG